MICFVSHADRCCRLMRQRKKFEESAARTYNQHQPTFSLKKGQERTYCQNESSHQEFQINYWSQMFASPLLMSHPLCDHHLGAFAVFMFFFNVDMTGLFYVNLSHTFWCKLPPVVIFNFVCSSTQLHYIPSSRTE